MTTWNENNLLPLMETRNARLLEYTVKDAIKMGNKNLTPEQRDEIYKAFTTKPDAFRKALKSVDVSSGDDLIDWTYDDFKTRVLDQLSIYSGKNARTGIEGLTEGKDYVELGRGREHGGWVAYLLLSFKGAQTLATNRVLPRIKVMSNSGELVDKATWCTAADEDSFQQYSSSGYLIDLFRFDPELSDPEKKVQFTVQPRSFTISELLNAENEDVADYQEVEDFLEKNVIPLVRGYAEGKRSAQKNNIADKLSSMYNPETHRYDISLEDPDLYNYLVSYTVDIPLGVVTGGPNDDGGAYSITMEFSDMGNFPTELKNTQLQIGSLPKDVPPQARVLHSIRLVDSILNLRQADGLIRIEEVEIEGASSVYLKAEQYNLMDHAVGQSLIDSMVQAFPYTKPIETAIFALNLTASDYLVLEEKGYKLPHIRDMSAYGSTLYISGVHRISGHRFQSLNLSGFAPDDVIELDDVGVRDTLSLWDATVQARDVVASNLNCHNLGNAVIEGIAVSPLSTAEVEFKDCLKLQEIPRAFYKAHPRFINCPRI